MNGWAVVVAGGVTVGYGALSRRLSTTAVSGPLVFMLCGPAIGPLGLDRLDPARDLRSRGVAGGRAVAPDVRGRGGNQGRELAPGGVPAAAAAHGGSAGHDGSGMAGGLALLPGLTVWELALVAAVLAPTDAALGQQAVSNKRVPALVARRCDRNHGRLDRGEPAALVAGPAGGLAEPASADSLDCSMSGGSVQLGPSPPGRPTLSPDVLVRPGGRSGRLRRWAGG